MRKFLTLIITLCALMLLVVGLRESPIAQLRVNSIQHQIGNQSPGNENKIIIPAGSVALTFDDGFVNDYTVVYPLLKEKGFPATFFIVSDWVNRNGFVSTVQLQEMQAKGFEIGSHAKTHTDLAKLTDKQVTDEATLSKKALEAMGLNIDSIALPFGGIPNNLNILPQFYKNIRQTGSSINTLPLNQYVYSIFPNNKAGTTVDTVIGWIEDAKKRGGVVVLGFHRIDPDESDNAWSKKKFVDLLNRLDPSKVFTFRDLLKATPSNNVKLLNKGDYSWIYSNSGTVSGSLSSSVPKGFGWDYKERSLGIDLKSERRLHTIRIKEIDSSIPRINNQTLEIWYSNDNVSFKKYNEKFDVYHYVDNRLEDPYRSMLVSLINPPSARYWKLHPTFNDTNLKTKVDPTNKYMDVWVE